VRASRAAIKDRGEEDLETDAKVWIHSDAGGCDAHEEGQVGLIARQATIWSAPKAVYNITEASTANAEDRYCVAIGICAEEGTLTRGDHRGALSSEFVQGQSTWPVRHPAQPW